MKDKRVLLTLGLALGAVIALGSCGEKPDLCEANSDDPSCIVVPTPEVEVAITSIPNQLRVGSTFAAEATVTSDLDDTSLEVTYSASSAAIANSVDEPTIWEAKSAGKATITATSVADTSKSATTNEIEVRDLAWLDSEIEDIATVFGGDALPFPGINNTYIYSDIERDRDYLVHRSITDDMDAGFAAADNYIENILPDFFDTEFVIEMVIDFTDLGLDSIMTGGYIDLADEYYEIWVSGGNITLIDDEDTVIGFDAIFWRYDGVRDI